MKKIFALTILTTAIFFLIGGGVFAQTTPDPITLIEEGDTWIHTTYWKGIAVGQTVETASRVVTLDIDEIQTESLTTSITSYALIGGNLAPVSMSGTMTTTSANDAESTTTFWQLMDYDDSGHFLAQDGGSHTIGVGPTTINTDTQAEEPGDRYERWNDNTFKIVWGQALVDETLTTGPDTRAGGTEEYQWTNNVTHNTYTNYNGQMILDESVQESFSWDDNEGFTERRTTTTYQRDDKGVITEAPTTTSVGNRKTKDTEGGITIQALDYAATYTWDQEKGWIIGNEETHWDSQNDTMTDDEIRNFQPELVDPPEGYTPVYHDGNGLNQPATAIGHDPWTRGTLQMVDGRLALVVDPQFVNVDALNKFYCEDPSDSTGETKMTEDGKMIFMIGFAEDADAQAVKAELLGLVGQEVNLLWTHFTPSSEADASGYGWIWINPQAAITHQTIDYAPSVEHWGGTWDRSKTYVLL